MKFRLETGYKKCKRQKIALRGDFFYLNYILNVTIDRGE